MKEENDTEIAIKLGKSSYGEDHACQDTKFILFAGLRRVLTS